MQAQLGSPIEAMPSPPVSGGIGSRRRQYWLAVGLAVLVGGLGHFSPIQSTLGVYLLLESLITMIAFIIGMFALIRYFSNRATLFLYGGFGFLAAGSLELIRLLAFTTGFAVQYRDGATTATNYLLWSGSVVHLHLAIMMATAIWDTKGLQTKLDRHFRTVGLYVGATTVIFGSMLLFAPVPQQQMWLGMHRPLELVPGVFWATSAILLYYRGTWKHDTFVHWLVMALIIAVGAAWLLYPFSSGLIQGHSLVAQLIKFVAFALVLAGLGNSMFELVRRVESSMLSVQQLNVSLENEIQVRRGTERALRASRAELDEAQQIAHLGSWTWDLATKQFQLSDEMYNILGRNSMQGPLTVDQLRACVHSEDLPGLTRTVQVAVAQGKEWESPCRIYRADGSIRIVLIRGRSAGESEAVPVRYRGVAQDVTDMVETQQRLRETAELLAASNRDLEEFAYIASHDLQEPLRKIFAFADRVMSKYGDVLDATGRDYLDRVRQSAVRMQGLIEAVLTLSRVNSRSEGFVQVKLGNVLADVVDDLAERIDETNAQVTISWLPLVHGDPVQMRQLFQNLIANALKFYRPESTPVVRVITVDERFLSNGVPFCTIMVEDEGIGFDPRYSERIFQPFHRLNSRARFEGTGMGLAICRRIVERHGGNIRAESRVNAGSRFLITLPLIQVQSVTKQAVNEHDFSVAAS